MIECVPGTVLPFDNRAFNKLVTDEYWVERERLRFDEDYLRLLPVIHGGQPSRPFFTDSRGTVHRIGWFVSFYDRESQLPGPVQTDFVYRNSDTRLVDRSLEPLLDGGMSIYAGFDDDGIRFYPFAALCGSIDDATPPSTLDWTFSYGSDSLCFDTSTAPISVVYCNFDKAIAERTRWEDAGDDYDYSHLVPVASSFREFASALQSAP